MLANPLFGGKRETQIGFSQADVLSSATVPIKTSSLDFRGRNYG
jgi:hypothetical protein